MDYAKKGFGAMSEEPTAAEVMYDTAIEAMDGKIRRLEEGGEKPAAAPARASSSQHEQQHRSLDDGEGFDFSALGDRLKAKPWAESLEALKDPVGSAESLKDTYVGAAGEKVPDSFLGAGDLQRIRCELFAEDYNSPAV